MCLALRQVAVQRLLVSCMEGGVQQLLLLHLRAGWAACERGGGAIWALAGLLRLQQPSTLAVEAS